MPTLNDVIWEHVLIPYLNVSLLGVDITEMLLSEDNQGVQGIEISLDYPQLNEFKTSNVILTLSNADGSFSPDNPTNFFITNGDPMIANKFKADGFGSEVTVDIGKIVSGASVSRRIFTGTVVDVELQVNPAQVKLLCVDGQQALREAVLQDFGIDRWLQTIADTDNNNPWGTYQVPAFQTPISEESVEVTTSTGEALTNVEQIRTEGRIREDAYDIRYAQGEVRTEGGELGAAPLIKFKEPWRWRYIDSLVREILTHTSTPAGTIDIPIYQTEERLMHTHGRVGWATEWRERGRTSASDAGWTGIAKDFVLNDDGTEAVFIYGGDNTKHALLHYNFETDTWTGLYEPLLPIELWQIATPDFDNFYVLGTSTGQYDALTGGSIKIWQYNLTAGTWAVVSEAGSGDPQLATPYHTGGQDTSINTFFHLRPDTRRMFVANSSDVFFVSADSSNVGVRSVASDYNTNITIPTVTSQQYAHDGFITNTSLYFVYIEGRIGQTLRVVQQAVDNPSGAATQIAQIDLNAPTEYVYFGVSNCVADGDDGFWCVLQKGRAATVDGAPTAGVLGSGTPSPGIGELVYIDLTNDTLTQLYSNEFTAGVSAGIRESSGQALFFLGSIYLQDNYLVELNDNEQGQILETTTTDAFIAERGWTSFIGAGAYFLDRCISPMRAAGESIFFLAGFNQIDDALGYDTGTPNVAQSPENWQLFELTKDVPLKLARLETHNLKAWDVLTNLATLTHTAIGFEDNQFTMRRRDAIRTRLTSDLAMGVTTLNVTDTSDFPASGHLLIRQEVLSYSAKTATTFTIDARGVHDSDVFNHTENAEAILINGFAFDHPIDANMMSINLEPDFINLYNQITVRYGNDNRSYIENADSVAANGERPYQLSLNSLSEHQSEWAKRLAQSYLAETGEVRSLISLTLRWSPELNIGEIIVVHYEDNVFMNWVPCRIIRMYHDVTDYTTQITAKEVPRYDLSAPTIGEILLPRMRVGEYVRYQIPATGVPTPTFSQSSLSAGLSLNATTGEITGTPTTAGETLVTLTATNSEGSYSTMPLFVILPETSYPILTFTGVTIPQTTIIKQNCFVDIEFPAAIGGKPPILHFLEGIPASMAFGAISRKLTGVSRTAGDTPIYYTATDSAVPTQAAIYAASVDLQTETIGVWTGLLVTADILNLIDQPTQTARQYNAMTGVREVANFADIALGAGDWNGTVATTDRKIFVDNTANRAVFYNLMNVEQTSEQIDLGAGNWQDVALIGTDRLGFLDRDAGTIQMYDTSRSRQASEDITFGFVAKFRSIAPNAAGDKIYVLIENLAKLLVWNTTTDSFDYDETIDLTDGSADWQAVTLHPDGHLLVIHSNATLAQAYTTAGARVKARDVKLV